MSDYKFWSSRYKQQASWTKQTRNFILNQISLPIQANVLEVGSGSCAVLDEFTISGQNTFGLDIDFEILRSCNSSPNTQKLINANGMDIPIQSEVFDLSFCHYLLLWIKNPVNILHEMARVTKRNGWICCFAEPDYDSRIDFPPPFEKIGQMQNYSLYDQGVNLKTGRNLIHWFQKAGLVNIHYGIYGAHQEVTKKPGVDDLETKTLYSDLEKIYGEEEINNIFETSQKSFSLENQVLFIPTFYAYAQVR